MAEIKWSPQQQRIIKSRNKNLLVSAAAGAGKTTVMIERIIDLIMQEKDGTDIDKMLIVTFTRDAASNMREKLSDRLTGMVDADPSDKRLIRQQMLLHNAKITTIDSFCNSVVKEFFYRIDMDPSFRIGDKAETALLRHKVMDDLLEDKYAEADPDFLLLVESYCGTKNDEKLNGLVEELAKASYAQAWPLEWLEELESDLKADIGAVTLRDEWKDSIADVCREKLAEAVDLSAQALAAARSEADRLVSEGVIVRSDAKLQKCVDILSTESSFFEGITGKKSYPEMDRMIKSFEFSRLTLLKDFSEDVQDKIKKARERYKNIIKQVTEKWFSMDEEKLAGACSDAAKPLCALIALTREYIERVIAAKKEKNIFEFSDISHFALQILARKNDEGRVEPTEAALELRERFHDIFIDEYQDSDAVQEQIAEVIAGPSGQKPYTFMVGDVKQSIYKFRMAKPELFINRAERYTADPAEGELIHLGLNYRSSRNVIDSVNDVFRLCMHEAVGRVEYDRDSELVCGKTAQADAQDGPDEGENADITEIIVARAAENDAEEAKESENDASEKAEEDAREEYTGVSLCATAAAKKIKQLIDSGYPIRNKDNTTRKISYGDIVILLRSTSKSAETYAEILENAGIPAFTDASGGFLNSYEISIVVNYLRLLDNPYQDIPCASVLHSPMGGLDDNELARVRIFGGFNVRFWQCVEDYAQNGPAGSLKEKCVHFLDIYYSIRRMNMTRDIDKVIFAIYEQTGFYLYCNALPQGDSRTSNLDLLLSYASQYEKGSSSGLFDFVGYIEEITRSDDDLEEAVNSEASNAVRIMTIHRSKGLEFPVVILADAARLFNLKDKDREVVISPDYGIASKCILPDRRLKCNTVRRTLMARRIEQDTIGEELRLLYVAMTRAMQKLIVVGAPGKRGKKKEDWIRTAESSDNRFPDHYTASALCYMDLLYPAALKNSRDFLIEEFSIAGDEERINTDIIENRKRSYENVSIPDEDVNRQIRREIDFIYEEDPASGLPVKLSVSDLKHEGMEEEGVVTPWRNKNRGEGRTGDDRQSRSEGRMGDDLQNRNEGRSGNELQSPAAGRITGAELGSLYHKIMQFLPFDLSGADEVSHFLNGMAGIEENETCKKSRCYAIISPAERAALDDVRFVSFLKTGLCSRMKTADSLGRLYREQPFMLGKRACEIYPDRYPGCEELIPVQGIIDCLFEEEDGLVILDYKTDLVDEGQELAMRYHRQLELYSEAASKILKKDVKERILYSFVLGECIALP